MFDFSEMNLEEKILNGYYNSKPYMKEKYVGNILNKPNLPKGVNYKY